MTTTLIVAYAFSVSFGNQTRESRDFAKGDKIVVERRSVLHKGAECPLGLRELVCLLRDEVLVKEKA